MTLLPTSSATPPQPIEKPGVSQSLVPASLTQITTVPTPPGGNPVTATDYATSTVAGFPLWEAVLGGIVIVVLLFLILGG